MTELRFSHARVISRRMLSHRIQISIGDITKFSGDAIVNAANRTLRGGGGVDGAIHRAAGPCLLEACRKLEGCPEGEAKITPGFDLEARHVIHTVGPVWDGGNTGESDVLASCYQSSLALATKHGLKNMAFPAISCGAYGYPVGEATQIAMQTVVSYLKVYAIPEEVTFMCFDDSMVDAYVCASKIQT